MTEEDLYKALEICYASFEKEKPYAGELVQAILDAALNAGFSAEEIRLIYVQIVMKSEAFDDPAFRSLQQFAENRFRFRCSNHDPEQYDYRRFPFSSERRLR